MTIGNIPFRRGVFLVAGVSGREGPLEVRGRWEGSEKMGEQKGAVSSLGSVANAR